jgi:energy-coupling factor transporter ATP-binding protein EcfA2
LSVTQLLAIIGDGFVPSRLAGNAGTRREMPHIEYLGFVVRHDAEDAESVVAACVAKLTDKGKAVWRAYPTGDQKFIPMLFVVSVAVKQRLAEFTNVEDGVAAGKILLRKPDPQFDFILNHLYDVRSKPKSYTSLFDELRHAVRFFFVLYGQKAIVHLQAPQGGLRPQQIFFWTVRDFLEQTGENLLPSEPTETKVTADPPQSNPHIVLGIPILAEKVRLHLAQPEPWYELYRKAVKAPEDLPTHKIPLYGSRVYSTEEKEQELLYKEQHLQLFQILTSYSMVLLTGPSGSGKTTILKMLMADLRGQKSPMPDMLPIFVPLKYVGLRGKSVTDLIVDSVVTQILHADALKRTLPHEIDIRRAKYGETGDPKSLFEAEVRKFFTSNEQQPTNGIVLLLDAHNEVPEVGEHDTEQEIQKLAERVDYTVVSTHSYGAFRLLPGFARFELDELSNEQIIWYLDRHFDGKGEQFFDDRLASDGRILSMARTPSYLELIVEYHKTYPDRRLPACPGPLLKFFVQKLYEKKRQVRKRCFPDVSEPDIDFFLRKLAYTLIYKGKEKAEIVLSYPDELTDIFAPYTLPELSKVAKAAEAIGFLDQSGQISEEPGTPGIIAFSHDNIRDFYAGQYLLQPDRLSELPVLQDVLEHRKWESALQMYFGLPKDRTRFTDDLTTITECDPFLATHCLLWSPLANEIHAERLMELFHTQRISELCNPTPELELYGVHEAIARILSLKSPESLVRIHCDPKTPEHVRDAALEGLAYAMGDGALPYLQEIRRILGRPNDVPAMLAIAELGTSQAWEYIVDEMINIAQQGKYPIDCQHYLCKECQFRPSFALVKKMLEKAKHKIKNPKVLDFVTSVLIYTTDDAGPDCTSELLDFETSTDPEISWSARIALIKNRHRPTIRTLLDKAKEESNFFSCATSVLMALLEINDPHVDNELWAIFEEKLATYKLGFDVAVIPVILAPRIDRIKLERTVRAVLQSDGRPALILFTFIQFVPEIMIDVSKSLLQEVEKNTPLWYRLIVTLCRCGDTDFADGLLQVLTHSDFVRCICTGEKSPFEFSTSQANRDFCKLALEAVGKLGLARAKPILQSIDEQQDNKLRNLVHDTLVSIEFLESTSTKLIRHFVDVFCEDTCVLQSWLPTILTFWKRCAPEMAKDFLVNVRDKVETAIADDNDLPLFELYRLLALLREASASRFSDIFHKWPLTPPA